MDEKKGHETIRIQYASDLHLEFEDKVQRKQKGFLLPETDANVIVLAGDIGTKYRGIDFAYKTATEHKKPVLYVAGNHEYWGSTFQHYVSKAKEYEEGLKKDWPNAVVHFLDNSSVTFPDKNVTFLGTTLWTNVLGAESKGVSGTTSGFISSRLNDYAKIKFQWLKGEKTVYKKLQPRQVVYRHERDKQWLEAELVARYADKEKKEKEKLVVITHHPPHPNCIAPSERGQVLDVAYANDFTDWLTDGAGSAKPDLWISGHTHYQCDFTIGKTRIVSNPRGYPGQKTGVFPKLVVDV